MNFLKKNFTSGGDKESDLARYNVLLNQLKSLKKSDKDYGVEACICWAGLVIFCINYRDSKDIRFLDKVNEYKKDVKVAIATYQNTEEGKLLKKMFKLI